MMGHIGIVEQPSVWWNTTIPATPVPISTIRINDNTTRQTHSETPSTHTKMKPVAPQKA